MADYNIEIGIRQSLTNLVDDLNSILNSKNFIERLKTLGLIFRNSFDNAYRVFFTGVGKTSFAADKLAATAKSIGLKSEFLNCQDAGHGDIGALPEVKKCYCIFMSKSGKTEEHFKLAKLIKQRKPSCVNVMFCFCNDELAESLNTDNNGIDIVINLPLDIKESDNYGIVPTNSNALFEACIAGAMIAAGMCDQEAMFKALQRNHPNGSLHSKVTKWLEEHEDE